MSLLLLAFSLIVFPDSPVGLDLESDQLLSQFRSQTAFIAFLLQQELVSFPCRSVLRRQMDEWSHLQRVAHRSSCHLISGPALVWEHVVLLVCIWPRRTHTVNATLILLAYNRFALTRIWTSAHTFPLVS